MQTRKLLSLCAIALLLVGWGITPSVFAGDGEVDEGEAAQGDVEPQLVFNQTLGAGQTSDVFRLICGGTCACARATIFNLAGGPATNGFVVSLIGDLFSGDGTFFPNASSSFTPPGFGSSGPTQVCQGGGQYLVAIYKNTLFADAYQADLRCIFANGAPCAHSVFFLLNQ